MALQPPSTEALYQAARGTISIEAQSEGMDSHNQFFIRTKRFWNDDLGGNSYAENPWGNSEEFIQTIEHNLQSINGVLRNTEMIHVHSGTDYYRSFESGFIDLLNVHYVYLHCPNLGHFNSIGVRGENTIIKNITVSSSFGYLIIDSVVAPHDNIDVSRQFLKKEFNLV